jgi:predicted Zn-dependent protease
VREITQAGVTKTGKNSFTISLDPGIFGDTLSNGNPTENSFSHVELILSMASALAADKKMGHKSDVDKFISQMETVCSSLK